eukprot:TRINITY_DN31208_c0_g1_i1.p1 TRINITY_DN31208_c0_g1~~TRINITY_DN31208_c0_g1_i1.p1  ORF type:complete len:196 (+),score=29.82 TRINITY_DN31208_c0_g1_i1:86-589(+)
MGVFGCSAGGAMTLMTLVELKRRGLELPAAAIASSVPSIGDSIVGPRVTWPSFESARSGRDAFFTAGWVDKFIQVLYSEPQYGYREAFKRTADGLDDLPPVMITVGSEEFLVSTAKAVADRIQELGGEVVYREHAGMQHCPQLYFPHFPEASTCLQEMADFYVSNVR